MAAHMIDVEAVMQSVQPTVGALFRWRVEKTPSKEAFRYPDANDTWVSIDWTETRRRVDDLAAGLLALGLQPEERVAIVSTTRIEWILVDYAINCAGGATTTVYPNTQGNDFAHIITDSGSIILIAENADQLAKLKDATEDGAQIRTSCCWTVRATANTSSAGGNSPSADGHCWPTIRALSTVPSRASTPTVLPP